MNNPFELLSLITARESDKRFGTAIAQALANTFGEKATDTDYAAAGIICTLFLSSMLAGFPTIKLHTYVRNYRDENSIFSFDCKSYDTILANIKNKQMLLIDSDFNYTLRNVSRQEISEALDFFTNQ